MEMTYFCESSNTFLHIFCHLRRNAIEKWKDAIDLGTNGKSKLKQHSTEVSDFDWTVGVRFAFLVFDFYSGVKPNETQGNFIWLRSNEDLGHQLTKDLASYFEEEKHNVETKPNVLL